MRRRLFTLEEANELIPWLERKFTSMLPTREQLAKRQEELLALLRNRRSNGHSSNEEDIVKVQQDVNRLTQQLQDELREVTDRGILVRDIGRGLVDFPAMREGQEIFLCWIMSEPEIAYWHETNTGFADRKPL